MSDSNQSRKYLLTIQRPQEKGYTHEVLHDILAAIKATYWCMSDEIAPTTGSMHTHVFIYRKTAIREKTIRRKFPDVHFDTCLGTCLANRAYVAKDGKWAGDPKADTSIDGTFEEWGVMPDEREEMNPGMADLIKAIESGKTTAEIIRDNPKYAFRVKDIDLARETLLTSKYREIQREVEVFYIFGKTGVGKTRSIFEKHPASDICRITSYGTNSNGCKFDAYSGQGVLVLEEYNSQIALPSLLVYLDRYPFYLPARYNDKTACYTKVYIVSNFSLQMQYQYEQQYQPEQWRALLRRISHILEYLPDGTIVEHSKSEYFI